MIKPISVKPLKNKHDSCSQYLDSIFINIRNFFFGRENEFCFDKEQISPSFVLVYIIKGKCQVKYKNKTQECSDKSLILFSPLYPFQFNMIEQPIEFYCVLFDIKPFYRAEEFLNNIVTDEIPIWNEKVFLGLEYTFDYIKSRMDSTYSDGAISQIKSVIYFIIAELMNYSLNKENHTGDIYGVASLKDMDLLNKFTSIIEKEIGTSVKISDICKQMNISESYLYKVCRRAIKVAPVKYLAMYKLDKAKQLLKEKKYSITEIAAMLGYSSVFHFSSSFKATLGITPSQYIKLEDI